MISIYFPDMQITLLFNPYV